MEQAGLRPEEEMSLTESSDIPEREEENGEDLGVFSDFVEGLDLDSLLGN
jgi:hypothetical protein